MPGLKIRLKEYPEQPGERRISVHWFFLPVGFGWLVTGVLGVRDWLLNNQPNSMYWGFPCAFLGAIVLVAFVLCQKEIRQGKPPEGLFTIRVRQLVLFGGVACWMAVCFILYQLLPSLAWTMPVLWFFGCALIWSGMVRYFLKHPPQH